MPPCGPDQNLKDISKVISQINNWKHNSENINKNSYKKTGQINLSL